MDKTTFKRATINALTTTAYVTAIGLLMSHADTVFGKHDKPFTPVVVLMLLVLSAAVTASLLFGQAVKWYLDDKKQQALQLLGATLACFAVLTLLAIVGLAVL